MARQTRKQTVDENEVIINTVSDVTQIESVDETPKSTIVKKEKKKFKDTDPIRCVSITTGKLGMIGVKTGINYSWLGQGDETEVEYQDLVGAIRSSKKHISAPYFIILDEEFLAQFPQVKKVYNEMYSVKDLQDIFKLNPTKMKEVINSLPDGAKETIKHMASSMIQNGTLDSVKKIQVLDEIYNTKMMLMTELFN